jgi:hypothetical protein
LKRCTNAAARARCALQMLIQSSGAAGGVLYAKHEQGLSRSVQIGLARAGAELDALARRYFESESGDPSLSDSFMGPDAFATAAYAWHSAGAERYVPVLLSHQPAEGFAVTGLVVLMLEPNAQFVYPGRIAEEFSRASVEHGDAVATYV